MDIRLENGCALVRIRIGERYLQWMIFFELGNRLGAEFKNEVDFFFLTVQFFQDLFPA